MKFEAFVRVIDNVLYVRLGRIETKFHGSVFKTLTRRAAPQNQSRAGATADNVSVGVTKDDKPVFVRIMDAVAADGRMMVIREKASRGDGLSRADVSAISKLATKQMRLVFDAYRAKMRKTISRHAGQEVGHAYDKDAKAHFDALVNGYAKGMRRDGSIRLNQE